MNKYKMVGSALLWIKRLDTVFIIGGEKSLATDKFIVDQRRFHPSHKTLNQKRCYHSAVEVGNIVYVIGGKETEKACDKMLSIEKIDVDRLNDHDTKRDSYGSKWQIILIEEDVFGPISKAIVFPID